MAMFAPIPLPDSGNQVFKDVMDYFETLQKRKSQQAQYGQQLALSKQAESRAQQLLPLQMQQYRDTHNREASDFEIQQMYNALQKNELKKYMEGLKTGNTTFGGTSAPMGAGMPSPVPGAMPGGSPDAMAQQPAEDKQAGNLANNASLPAIPGLGQLNQLMQQNQAPAGMSGIQNPASGTQMPAPPPMPSMPGAAVPPVNNQAPMMGGGQGAMPSPTPAPTTPSQMGNAGQEVVLRQGNPAMEFMNTLAGLNSKFPKPQTHVGANGVIYTTYPNGKLTMQQPAPGMKTVAQETPEERQNREVSTAEDKYEAKAHTTQNMSIENTNRDLTNMYKLADSAEKIIKADPNLTGIGWKIPLSKAAAGSGNLGKLQSIFGTLQSLLSKASVTRPGIGSLTWAASVKPDTGNNTKYNMGQIKELKDYIKNQIDSDNEIYSRNKNGKKLPHPDEGETISIVNPKTNEKLTLTKKEARERGMKNV